MAVAIAVQENNNIFGVVPTAVPTNDIWIKTSTGNRIPAHYDVMATASPVLESIVYSKTKKTTKPVIQILGVPNDAVLAFVTILYSKRDGEHRDLKDEHAIYLLVLSHAYQVKWLKSRCERQLASRVTTESVVDLMQLAKQCDAQMLYLRCMQLMHKEFASVEKTEGWVFLQENDPMLELEVLQFQNEVDMRQKRRRRRVEKQRTYMQLSDAMDCLQQLCTEDGCTEHIDEQNNTCHELQKMFNHINSCRKYNRIGCSNCQRMWNLLRLHSSICDVSDQCKVPLCKQFKMKKNQDGKADNGKWEILAKKLKHIRVMSSFVKRRM